MLQTVWLALLVSTTFRAAVQPQHHAEPVAFGVVADDAGIREPCLEPGPRRTASAGGSSALSAELDRQSEVAMPGVEEPDSALPAVEILSETPSPRPPLVGGDAPQAHDLEAAIRSLPSAPPSLSVRPASVVGVARPIVELGGTWRFHSDPRFDPGSGDAASIDDWPVITVPGEWAMQGFAVRPGIMACYARRFSVPDDWLGCRVRLRFDAVHSVARVWINGRDVGGHEGGFVPFELDITDAVRVGDNRILVGVRSESTSDTLASLSQYAAHQVGGIIRKVVVFALPPVHLDCLVVTTAVPGGDEPPRLQIDASVAGEGADPEGSTLRMELFAPGGGTKPLAMAEWTFRAGESRRSFAIDVPSAELWDPEHPRLHTLRASLERDGIVLQTAIRRVGFRQVEVRGTQLLVNSRPVKLLGVCRHEVHPLLGRSLTAELCWRDAELFRAANCNFVRTSHYPPSEEFLDACDELGLFVESEAALCWVEHGANPAWKERDHLDPDLLAHLVRANEENVIAGRDHPSVLLWSLGNESAWSPLWAITLERVQRLDPSRPAAFHDQCWGTYNNGHSTAPIAVYHYPGEDGPARCDLEPRPVLFGEYAHVECYNRRELVTDPGIRDDWGRPLERMVDLMQAHAGCLGGAIWAGIDDTFHLPDGRIVGYGPWGPLDGWRRPKPEYWHVKNAYSPIRVRDRHAPLRALDGVLRMAVENRYLFTNLSEVGIAWSIGGQRGRVSLDLPPRTDGVIEIRPPLTPRSGDVLRLEFTDPRGFVCCEEALPIENPQESAPPAPAATRAMLSASESTLDVQAGRVRWRVDRQTGRWIDLMVGESTFLLGGPELMVLPLNTDTGGDGGVSGNDYQNRIEPFTPVSAGWTSRRVEGREVDGVPTIEVEGACDDAEGSYTLRFAGDGSVDVAYSFNASVDVNPRQWGLVLVLPHEMDTLRWDRRAQWTTYPSDHIGRLSGVARANPKEGDSVEEPRIEPSGPWSLDASALGTNDFRSTRYRIRQASLLDLGGRGIRIESGDETTSVRAWLEDRAIRVLVAGFHTGGADGFFAGHFASERRPLKAGDGRIEGSFTVRPIGP